MAHVSLPFVSMLDLVKILVCNLSWLTTRHAHGAIRNFPLDSISPDKCRSLDDS